MTVSELMEKLKGLPPELRVAHFSSPLDEVEEITGIEVDSYCLERKP